MLKNMEKGIKRKELFDSSAAILMSEFLPILNPIGYVLHDE